MSLKTIRIAAKGTPTASMIIVHGLGDSGEGWTFLPNMLDFSHINYIFPSAEAKPLTVSGGNLVPRWFDIFEFGNPNARQDEQGYWESVSKINSLIDQEIARGIPPERIIVGGFSQGAAVSLGVAATYKKKLGGILCLSGFFPARKSAADHVVDVNKNTDIFHGHGDRDPVISLGYARTTAEFFKNLGFTNYNLNEYPGLVHSTNNAEMAQVREFVEKHLP